MRAEVGSDRRDRRQSSGVAAGTLRRRRSAKVAFRMTGIEWRARPTSVHQPLHLPATACWGVGSRSRVRDDVVVHVARFPSVVAAKHASTHSAQKNLGRLMPRSSLKRQRRRLANNKSGIRPRGIYS